MNGFDMSKLLFSLLEPHCHRILLDHHSPSNKWTYSRHLCLQRWLWHGILIDSFFEQADIFQFYFSICQDLTFELQLLAPFVLCLKSAVSSRCLDILSAYLHITLHARTVTGTRSIHSAKRHTFYHPQHNVVAACNLQLKASALLQPIQSRQKRPFIKS